MRTRTPSRFQTPSIPFAPFAGMVAAVIATAPSIAHASCDRLTRTIANRVSAAARRTAPAWVRPMLTPQNIERFDSTSLHSFDYLLGYGGITLERLGVRGAPPFRVAVAVRCRDGQAQVVRDPYAWATALARRTHPPLGNAEQAAGYAAEVVSLVNGVRPDSASARRDVAGWLVTVSMAARPGGDTAAAPQTLTLRVDRNGAIAPER